MKPHAWPSDFGVKNSGVALPAIVRGSSMWDDLNLSSGGLPVPNEQTAMTVSVIYAAINLLAGAIAALPMHLYRQKPDGERERMHNDALWWVLNEEMTPRWSAASGWEFMVQSLLLHGDAFAKIQRNGYGDVIGIQPIHPLRVYVVPWEDGSRLTYIVEPDTTLPLMSGLKREILDQDDVLHVAGFGFNGVRGLSPLRHSLRMTGAVALATQEFSARFFANSARPDFVIQTDQQLSGDKVDQLREQMEQRNGSVTYNAHRPMVLANGLKLQTISMPLEDMQLIGTRQFQVEEISRIYGIPPFMLGHNENTTSWGSGVESMGKGFVRYALRQHLNKFQNEINRKFFRSARKVAVFDTSDLERADMKSHFEALRIAVGRAGEAPFMTKNEVRAELNMKNIDGGDSLEIQQAPATGGTDAPTSKPPGK